jgi:hypothetical protein
MDATATDAALLTCDKGCTQRGESGFLFFQQAQTSTHDITGAAVASFTHLCLDEAVEMLADAERSVFVRT